MPRFLLLLLSPLLLATFWWGALAQAQGGGRFVASAGECGTAVPCYATVQAAVSAAAPGETIYIAAGHYSDTHTMPAFVGSSDWITAVVLITKSIHLQGGYTPTNWETAYPITQPTVLDAGGLGSGVWLDLPSPTAEASLTGLVVTGGGAPLPETRTRGGGVVAFGGRVAIQHSQIVSNSGYAGGIYAWDNSLTAVHNTITHNQASEGGGILIIAGMDSRHEIQHNTIAYNRAVAGAISGVGGGIVVADSPLLMLAHNDILSNTSEGPGGGVVIYTNHSYTLSHNLIQGNVATEGGGVLLISNVGHGWLVGNEIRHNQVLTGGLGFFESGSGGGISVRTPEVTLINNLLAENYASVAGDALAVFGNEIHLLHNTLADNGANPIWLFGGADEWDEQIRTTLSMTNTLMVGAGVGVGTAVSITGRGASLTVDTVLWPTAPLTVSVGLSATNIVVSVTNPVVGEARLAADHLRLLPGSAAIDVARPTSLATDLRGNPRPLGPSADLGAYEALFRFPLYLPMVVVSG